MFSYLQICFSRLGWLNSNIFVTCFQAKFLEGKMEGKVRFNLNRGALPITKAGSRFVLSASRLTFRVRSQGNLLDIVLVVLIPDMS